jgi:hypothetical protein
MARAGAQAAAEGEVTREAAMAAFAKSSRGSELTRGRGPGRTLGNRPQPRNRHLNYTQGCDSGSKTSMP